MGNSIRVLANGHDAWLFKHGDQATLDIPGGRVTLAINGGWSDSGIAYCDLSYQPIRAGLMRFERPASPKRSSRSARRQAHV